MKTPQGCFVLPGKPLFLLPGPLQSARKETGLKQQGKRDISQEFPQVSPPWECTETVGVSREVAASLG